MQPSGWSTPWFRHRGVSLRFDARVQGGGPLFEKPRKTTGGPKGGFIGRREHFTYVYTVFGQLDGQVFEWFQTFFRWAKYCLASLSSSRLPTHRRVQHLISVFNNIELRLQNGPMCESTLLFRFVFFFQGRSHGFVFFFEPSKVRMLSIESLLLQREEVWRVAEESILNGIQWEFMEIVVDN